MKSCNTIYEFYLFQHGGNCMEIYSIHEPSQDFKSIRSKYNLTISELHRKFDLIHKALGDPTCHIGFNGAVVLTWKKHFSVKGVSSV